MFDSNRSFSKTRRTSVRLLVLSIIAFLVAPLSGVQAEATGEHARRIIDSGMSSLRAVIGPSSTAAGTQQFEAQTIEDPSRNARKVTHFRLCPRRLRLYVGEAYTLVPTPIDNNRDAVDGVAPLWETSDPKVADVSSWGEVSALGPGNAILRARAGTAQATVSVEVHEGGRPRQSDLEYDLEHARDCDEPEAAQLEQPQQELAEFDAAAASEENHPRGSHADTRSIGNAIHSSDLPTSKTAGQVARPAMLRSPRPQLRQASYSSLKAAAARPAAARKKFFGRGFFVIDPIDGSGGDPSSPAAAAPNNAVGSYRFGAQEASQGSPTKTKNLLGSYNFTFSAPLLNLGGRGIGVNLGLIFNSRLWNKDTAGMTFNYNKGWPAAGWTLGYGRIIQNYDGTATGDQSGVGYFNSPGNYLLIQPDGSRIYLQANWDSAFSIWKHDSTDGTFLHLNDGNGKLKYPDGTVVKYNLTNNRLLPASIRNRNGDLITIAYRNKTSSFKYRWAIDSIVDSLGRVIQFHYYGDTGYPADDANGKTTNALATITTPNFGSGTRTLVQLYYQNITLQYNFSVPVDQNNSPASGSTLTVMKRIYYPATGTGYLFPDYSSYGMIRYISIRNNMTGAGGTVTDGTEIAYTKYDYVDVNTQVGQLNDSPQYTRRSEWWQGMTDENGTAIPATSPADYTYSRTVDTLALNRDRHGDLSAPEQPPGADHHGYQTEQCLLWQSAFPVIQRRDDDAPADRLQLLRAR